MTTQPQNLNLNPKTFDQHKPGTTRKQFFDLLKKVIRTKPERAVPPASTSSKT